MKHLIVLSALLLLPALALGQPNFETPKAVAIDADTLKQIEAKAAELQKAVAALPATRWEDVEIYAKAAEWMLRHGEFFAKETPKQTLSVIDAGLARAKKAAAGESPWDDVRGKSIVRAYRSAVDGSLQPYSLLLPEGFGKAKKAWSLEVVLHGRDQTLTEVKFIAGKEAAKGGSKSERAVVEIYGRGNNAYRWAGEQDVLEAIQAATTVMKRVAKDDKAVGPVLLRGFSMGGAGTWHLGLHHPSQFLAISPGAGFTNTHGYIKNLPKLPDYQERTLHIYDAVDYAENAFDVPVVAYSGSIDPQKAAADNIENALKGFKEPLRFTHLVAPGLEHKQPPEWLAKVHEKFAEYEKAKTSADSDRVRFVTYTLRYAKCKWISIDGLERHYEKAVIDASRVDRPLSSYSVMTENVSRFHLPVRSAPVDGIVIDGQNLGKQSATSFVKVDGRWKPDAEKTIPLRKSPGLQGPIDDVFHTPFTAVGPTAKGWSDATDGHAKAALDRFGREWDKYFRGQLPMGAKEKHSMILFGDPASNPAIKAIQPKLPIQWTKEKLVVNGVEYDAATHVPVMIYPHPTVPGRYVVLNSGHTFRDADLKGTNALLYPRLGDWAVLKPKPTKDDPAAAEVVAAGIFDENWQFEKRSTQ